MRAASRRLSLNFATQPTVENVSTMLRTCRAPSALADDKNRSSAPLQILVVGIDFQFLAGAVYVGGNEAFVAVAVDGLDAENYVVD